MSLALLSYNQIDKTKWDDCIQASPNGLVYGCSSYLDEMSPEWKGIILNDYEAVMPLTWRKKWNIPYLYQPAFIQQGGIFSKKNVDPQLVDGCLQLASEHFRYAAFTLNYANPVTGISIGKSAPRSNFLVRLDGGGFSTKNDYLAKRFRRASKNQLAYVVEEDFVAAVKLYRKLYGSRLPAFKKEDYLAFENICRSFSKKGEIMIRSISSGKETLALVLLLHFKDRWYNMISCITENGKKQLANYYLYGMLLEELSAKNEWLDLEGSDVAGIKFFYQKMADAEQPYPFVSYNHLPGLIRLIKK